MPNKSSGYVCVGVLSLSVKAFTERVEDVVLTIHLLLLKPTKPLADSIRPVTIVRRQNFWNQERRKQRESLALLVGFIMRRAVCDASDALRVFFV